MKDIHDIRPPVFAGFNPSIIDILLIILALIAIITLIWFLFRLYKKRSLFKKNKNILLLPSPLPAEDIALQEIGLITDLMEKNRRLFYFKLTAILKSYISKKFSINAREMTSQELIKSLNILDIKSNFFTLISKFLEFSDNIKYAAMPASTQEVKKDFNLIKEFIKTTSTKQNECLEKEMD
jgi:ribosomal protein S18